MSIARTFTRGLLVAALAVAAGVAQADFQPNYPDTCTSAFTPGAITVTPLPAIGGGADVRWTAGSLPGKKLVVIFNGNGFTRANYADLADHLARNGFIAAVVQRPSPGDSAHFAYDATIDVLASLGIAVNDAALRVAWIGHSYGGKRVATAALYNFDQAVELPLQALVALAPVADSTTSLTGHATPNLLTIYGSQDEDTDGYDATPNEAFRFYDQAGTEETTTCNTPPCAAPAPNVLARVMDKSMVHLRGAGHAGLVNAFPKAPLPGTPSAYLSIGDQFCATKAYVTGFLRWKLLNVSTYKGLLRGEWQPASVSSIVSSSPDAFGNPAGSPLRIEVQSSPNQRKVIANFESALPAHTKTTPVQVELLAAGDLPTAPQFIRHDTGMAAIGWSSSGYIRFTVPAGSRVGTGYTHFALRAGQLQGMPVPYDNTLGANQRFWLGLEDGAGQIYWKLFDKIAPPDANTGNPAQAKSNLHTLRVPVASITGIDLDDVRYVRLLFSAGTHGTLLFDSLEWQRD